MNPRPQAGFPAGYEYQEFPKDVHRASLGERGEVSFETKTVQDPDDEKDQAPAGEGWHVSRTEAVKIAKGESSPAPRASRSRAAAVSTEN